MFGDAYNEAERADVVEGLLDTRLLPATNVDGVIFDRNKIEQRLDKYAKFMASNKLRAHLGDVESKMAAAGASGVQKTVATDLPRLLNRNTTTGLCCDVHIIVSCTSFLFKRRICFSINQYLD